MGLIGNLKKKAIDAAKKKVKKKIKRRVIIILVVIGLLVLLVFGIFTYNLMRNLRIAAVSSSTNDWVNNDSWRDKRPNTNVSGSIANPVYDANTGGLTGLGYDFINVIENTTEDDPQHLKAQTLYLLDRISVELNQPCTLLGIALLGKESGYWYAKATAEEGKKLFNDGQWDLYKYRSMKFRTPGIGGGRVWHPIDASSLTDAKSIVDSTHKNWVYKNDAKGGFGYYNCGAFGLIQVEAWTWKEDDPNKYKENGIAILNADGHSELQPLKDNKEFVDYIMQSMGKNNYIDDINAFSGANGITYNSHDEFASDPCNPLASCFIMSMYFAEKTSALPNVKTNSKHSEEKWNTTLNFDSSIGLNENDYSYATAENLSEAEKNVLATIWGLYAWNGGANNLTSTDMTQKRQLRKLLLYDLAKYLVANGAQALYADGYSSISNASGASLETTENANNLKTHLDIVVDALYHNNSNKKTVMTENLINPLCDINEPGIWDGMLYAIDGIIRAQSYVNEEQYANIKASDGSCPNIYTALYTMSLNTAADGAAGVIARALSWGSSVVNHNRDMMGDCADEYLRVKDDRQSTVVEMLKKCEDDIQLSDKLFAYYQDGRKAALSGGPYFDCSSFASACFSKAGLSYFDSLPVAASIGKKLWDLSNEGKAILVVGKDDLKNSNKDATGPYDSAEAICAIMQPGDLIFYNYDYAETDRWNGIDHVAIYEGNGLMIDSTPGSTVKGTNIYVSINKKDGTSITLEGPGLKRRVPFNVDRIVLVVRLTDASVEALSSK